MNCSDIAEILDNGNVSRLDTAERRQVDAHLSGCPGCARDWILQARFSELPDIAEPAGFAALCRAQVARSARGGNMRSRLVLISAVMALAAAAAWVVVNRNTPVHAPITAQRPAPVPEVAHNGLPSIAPLPESPAAVVADSPPQEVRSAVPAPTKFTVRVLPIDNRATDAESRAAVEAFYTAVIRELRAIPELTLMQGDSAGATSGTTADYWITLGGSTNRSPGQFNAEVRSEQRAPDGKVRAMSGSVTQGNISCAVVSRDGPDFCQDAAAIAATVVDRLRKSSFPRNAAVQRALQATLLNPGLRVEERLRALGDLSMRFDSSPAADEALKDPATVRGAIALANAGADARQRAQVWRTMRGVTSVELVRPLITAAREDTDGDVRREAVVSLSSDFARDPEVRAVLETVAHDDSSSLNRALAQRGLSGEQYWKDYVSTTLKDTGRQDSERMEAFIHHALVKGRQVGSSGYANADVVKQVLDDDAVVALADLLPRVFAANPRDAGRNFQVLYQVASIIDHPAIDKMVLDNLESGRDPSAWLSIAAGMARRRHGDPALRVALEKYAAPDANPALRGVAEAALQELSK